ncbi:MAG: radical SAM protein [Candidatus Tectomicrobia bacterium]|uniref:Radical SAM protein n=1 Tax=Tectimicrobiota bacterium TaxID=2528274 RepID=A0A938B0T9_UNCTE|nr:radical SAM protein [Candidatus Tectomicrobia bacterium]
MPLNIVLVNPPIYDFSAYDFWLKPYGLLQVAGYLRGQASLALFDYLDRCHPLAPSLPVQHTGTWERGPFYAEDVPKPPVFAKIPRTYRRYGLPRALFQAFLAAAEPFDVALIQTVMTYWYPGVREVIEDIRARAPQTRIVLGGVYATLCPQHARSLGADLVVDHASLEPLWQLLQCSPRLQELPLWESYDDLRVGVLKLADGCPFTCTYCSVPQVYPPFIARPLERSLAELAWLRQCGAQQVAFYDDALLFKPAQILLPFLREVLRRGLEGPFHTPNALNARFITPDIANLMVQAGFQTFYLGFESSAYTWQRHTGGKVYAHELERAVEALVRAGADIRQITAYLIMAHPQTEQQDVEASMHFAHALGLRLMLSEFSPIPGTPDGERCRAWVDLDEPLWHNKTVFPLLFLGAAEVQRLKALCRALNSQL